MIDDLKERFGVDDLTTIEKYRIKQYIQQAIENNRIVDENKWHSHNRLFPYGEALALYLHDYGIDINDKPNFQTEEEIAAYYKYISDKLSIARHEQHLP